MYMYLRLLIIAPDKSPASILYKSIAGPYWPVGYPDGLIMARYRFMLNAYWEVILDSFCISPLKCVVGFH